MQTGNRVIIQYNDNLFISFIDEVLSENKILIQLPYVYKNESLLNENETYNIIINTKDKVINALVKAVGIKFTNRRKYYIIDILNSICKDNQKRKYERYFCNLHYKINLLLAPHKQENINVIIKDISLGGIRFLTNSKIENYLCFKMKIWFENDYFIADSKIVQSQYYPKANYKNQYRIKFENTENEYLLKNYFENFEEEKFRFTLR